MHLKLHKPYRKMCALCIYAESVVRRRHRHQASSSSSFTINYAFSDEIIFLCRWRLFILTQRQRRAGTCIRVYMKMKMRFIANVKWSIVLSNMFSFSPSSMQQFKFCNLCHGYCIILYMSTIFEKSILYIYKHKMARKRRWMMVVLFEFYNNNSIKYVCVLTDGFARDTRYFVAEYLGDCQEQIADQQTCNVVCLATPMQHMVVGWQEETGRQCGNQKYDRYQQTNRVKEETDVLYGGDGQKRKRKAFNTIIIYNCHCLALLKWTFCRKEWVRLN